MKNPQAELEVKFIPSGTPVYLTNGRMVILVGDAAVRAASNFHWAYYCDPIERERLIQQARDLMASQPSAEPLQAQSDGAGGRTPPPCERLSESVSEPDPKKTAPVVEVVLRLELDVRGFERGDAK